MEIDETWYDLSELYSVVAGPRLAMWLVTVDLQGMVEEANVDASGDPAFHEELREYRKATLADYGLDDPVHEDQLQAYRQEIAGTKFGGHVLLDEDYTLTEFGEDLNGLIGSAKRAMLANPEIPVRMEDDEEEGSVRYIEDTGDILGVLGSVRDEDGKPIGQGCCTCWQAIMEARYSGTEGWYRSPVMNGSETLWMLSTPMASSRMKPMTREILCGVMTCSRLMPGLYTMR